MTTHYPIIGMSPGNSYFKEAQIERLLKYFYSSRKKLCVFVPDVPAISTYEGLGYSKSKAQTKAMSKGNNLKNKVAKIAIDLDIPSEALHVLDWKKEITSDGKYIDIYEHILKRFNRSQSFSQDVRESTRSVLEKNQFKSPITTNAVDIAIHYILSEFAFLAYAPEFFNMESIEYIYHKPWPVYEKFINGEYDGVIAPALNFLVWPD